MGYIATLNNYKYNFKELPIDILENVKLILSSPITNQKLTLLDQITFNLIRQTQPTNEVIETLFDIYKNENTLRENNGFNTLREIDEAQELFDNSLNNMVSAYYDSLIPNGYLIDSIEFDRSKYGYIGAKNWLKDNNFDFQIYPVITSDKIIFEFKKKTNEKLEILEFSNSIKGNIFKTKKN